MRDVARDADFQFSIALIGASIMGGWRCSWEHGLLPFLDLGCQRLCGMTKYPKEAENDQWCANSVKSADQTARSLESGCRGPYDSNRNLLLNSHEDEVHSFAHYGNNRDAEMEPPFRRL